MLLSSSLLALASNYWDNPLGIPSALNAGVSKGGYPGGFIANKGQWDDRALFVSTAPGVDAWITKDSIKYDFYKVNAATPGADGRLGASTRSGHVVEMRFLNTISASGAIGVKEQSSRVNFLSPGASISNVPTFEEARIVSLYNGVDMRLYQQAGYPRFDLLVAPGVDPQKIRFKYDGADETSKVGAAELKVGTTMGPINIRDMKAFEPTSGTHVACEFVQNEDGSFGFKVGPHDTSKPLVIDPLVYSTMFGPSGGDTVINGVAVDSFGYPYVTGATNAATFPASNGAYINKFSGIAAYVSKLQQDASNLVFSTFLNSTGNTQAFYIAIDTHNRPVVAGFTTGALPVTGNAPQKTFGGTQDNFVLRLFPDGSNVSFATYWGGSKIEDLRGLGLDSADDIFIAGNTGSSNFPTSAGAVQAVNPSPANTHGFLTRFSPTGAVSFSTYIGGNGPDTLTGLAVDRLGFAYVVGGTQSDTFPITKGALDSSRQFQDAFITKVDASGSKYVYSTFFGGSAGDLAQGVAVDQQGSAYLIGQTGSTDFPLTPGAFDSDSPGARSGNFVAKLTPDGSSLVFSTLTAGGGVQRSIVVDDLGISYVCGTANPNFTGGVAVTGDADFPAYSGTSDQIFPGDMFLQVFNDAGTNLVYGSYYGGGRKEVATGLCLDKSRNVYLTGWSTSFDTFPTTPGVFQPAPLPNDNFPNPDSLLKGVLLKIKVHHEPLVSSFAIGPNIIAGSEVAVGTITLNAPASAGGAFVHLTTDNPNVTVISDNNNNPLSSNTLVIAEGQNVGTFNVVTSDVVQTYVVGITEELEGQTKKQFITIEPWLQSLTLSPTSVVGGNKLAGRVALVRPAPANGLTVSISSSDNTKAFPVDASGAPVTSVNVPAGANAATFDIKTRGVDSTVTVTMLVRITSPALSYTRSESFTIVPARLQTITFTPSTINGGEQSIGSVNLDGEAGPTSVPVSVTLGSGTAPITFLDNKSTTGINLIIPPFSRSKSFKVLTGVQPVNAFRVFQASGPNGAKAQGTLFVQEIAFQSVDLSSNTVLGGNTITGHVTLTNPVAPGGFSINISSSNSNYAKLSVSKLVVPAGAIRSDDFTITTPVVNGQDVTVKITASKAGYSSISASLIIRHLGVTFTMLPSTVTGGIQDITGTVKLSETSGAGGLRFDLQSTAQNGVQDSLPVPFHVDIAQGSDNASFNVKTHVVNATETFVVQLSTAALPSQINRFQTITIKPLSLTVSLNPSTVTGGKDQSQGTITLSSPATGAGLKVTITSDKAAAVPPSTPITIPAGSKVGKFTISTIAVATDVAAVIKATISGGGFNTAPLEILSPRSQSITVDDQVVVGGNPTAGTVSINAPAPSGGLSVALRANNSAVQLPATVHINANAQTARFNVGTSSVASDTTVTLTASYPSTHSVTTTMVVQAPRSGALSFNPTDVVGGSNSTGTVSIDVAAPVGGMKVTLAKDPNASGSAYVTIPATVTIPQGAKSTTFTVTTKAVSRTVATSITATFGTNGQQVTAALTVEPTG
jgi:hypothetical protein